MQTFIYYNTVKFYIYSKDIIFKDNYKIIFDIQKNLTEKYLY